MAIHPRSWRESGVGSLFLVVKDESIVGDEWLDEAVERITTAPTVGESLKTAAGYLTDLLDALQEVRGESENTGDYRELITQEIALIEITSGGDEYGQELMWEMAGELIDLYQDAPQLSDREIVDKTRLAFEPILSHHPEPVGGLRGVFASIISYIQGWLAAEVVK